MKLKSTLSDPVLNFRYISFGSLLTALLYGIIASFLIIGIGDGGATVFLKLAMIVVPIFFILDNNDMKTNEDTHEFRKLMLTVVMAFFICEVNLYLNSSYEKEFDVTVITSPNESDGDMLDIKYYDVNGNDSIEYIIVNKNQKDLIKYHKSVVKMKKHIDYTPFVHYDEVITYTRKEK